MADQATIDALRAACRCVTDAAEMAPYLEEMRHKYQSVSDIVCLPSTTQEVAEVISICARAGVAVVPQGGNTGLVGGAVAQGAAILNLKRMNRVLEVDPVNRTMSVEAGCILADVQKAAKEAGLYFPLSLAAEGSCQIGGNLATNAGGVHVLRYGNARDLVLGLEVVLANGQVWNGLTGLRKNNTGYDLKQLFLGSEGTLGVITRAVLKLYALPKAQVTALAAVEDFFAAQALFQAVQAEAGDHLSAFEVWTGACQALAEKHIPDLKSPFAEAHPAYALMELTSANAAADLQSVLETALTPGLESGSVLDAAVASSESQRASLWKIRESIPDAQRAEGASIKHDISVPTSAVAEFTREGLALFAAEMPDARPIVFGHLGDGNLHFNLSEPEGCTETQRAEFLAQWEEINAKVHDLVARFGGSFSAEHGVGLLKTGEMARLKDPVELALMQTLKDALDPAGLLNPGKVLPTTDA